MPAAPRMSVPLACLLFLAVAGCHTSRLTEQRLEPCRALVAAAPDTWPEHWRKVYDLGPDATPALVHCLRENATGPGRQAAIHLLGEWRRRDAATAAFLQDLVKTKGPDATAAALALGKQGDRTSLPLLVDTTRDHTVATETRVAAACSLLDQGRTQDAVPLMRAVLLAASPYGHELEREHGLPLKTRWAAERYMIIEAIRRYADGKTFGLDEDAPWPTLRDGTAAFLAYVKERTGSHGR